VQTKWSSDASQQSTETTSNSITHHHYHYHCSNTSIQPNASSSPSPKPPRKLSCHHQALLDKPTEQEITSLLGHQLRPLPPIDSGSPVLSYSNWEGLASKEHAGDQEWEGSCNRSL
jgi:hypothetical protein